MDGAMRIPDVMTIGEFSDACGVGQREPVPRQGGSTRDVHVLDVGQFGLSTLGVAFPVQVHLPPDYEKSGQRYPLLYMLDGQNSFDCATAFLGRAWDADKTHDRLLMQGRIRPFVIASVWSVPVALASPPPSRGYSREELYSPVAEPMLGGVGGQLGLFERLLFEEIEPRLRRDFRLLDGHEHTGVLGSSLGGLAAVNLALRNPGRFGCAAAMSPALYWADRCTLRAAQQPASARQRVWLDIGADEDVIEFEGKPLRLSELPGFEHPGGKSGEQDIQELAQALGRHGHEVRTLVAPGGRHDEPSWGRRLPEVLAWLFPPIAS